MKRSYLSYLLRIWQTGSPQSPQWVASLEDPHSHQVTHFRSLDALAQFLLQKTSRVGDRSPQDADEDEPQPGSHVE